MSKFGIFSGRSKWFPFATDNHGRNLVISLWPGDKATISGVAAWRLNQPKFLSSKIRWKISRINFLVSSRHPPHWLASKGPNYERGDLHIPDVAIEECFEEKRCGDFSMCVVFLHELSRLTGHLQPRRNWPTWVSNVLITHPILRIWPRRTTTCSLDWKTIESSTVFVQWGFNCCCGDVFGRTNFRTFCGMQI